MTIRILLLFLFLIAFSSLHADEDRVLASLTRKVEFNSAEEAGKWKLEEFTFKDWLSAVADPSWEFLMSTQTTDFYFAVFRSGNDLIFWNLDRKAQYRSTSTATIPRWQGPSKWVTLKHEVSYPSGGFTHQANGRAFEISDDHEGILEIRHSAGRKQVFQASILWKSKAEQAGAGQPASAPELKPKGKKKPKPASEARRR